MSYRCLKAFVSALGTKTRPILLSMLCQVCLAGLAAGPAGAVLGGAGHGQYLTFGAHGQTEVLTARDRRSDIDLRYRHVIDGYAGAPWNGHVVVIQAQERDRGPGACSTPSCCWVRPSTGGFRSTVPRCGRGRRADCAPRRASRAGPGWSC